MGLLQMFVVDILCLLNVYVVQIYLVIFSWLFVFGLNLQILFSFFQFKYLEILYVLFEKLYLCYYNGNIVENIFVKFSRIWREFGDKNSLYNFYFELELELNDL